MLGSRRRCQPRCTWSIVALARQRRLGPLPQLVNISDGSLIVRTDELLQRGQKVLVTIHFVDLSDEVKIETEVVWSNPQLGDMALRFLNISDRGVEAIANYLAERGRDPVNSQ